MTILYTLLEVTIYSAILFGAIWLFRLLLKKHLSSAMLYMAWFILIARLLMPVTITSGLSLFVIPAQGDAVQAESVMTTLLDGLDNTVVLEQDAQTKTDSAVQQSEASKQQAAPNTAVETSATSVANVPLEISWETALLAIWLAGAVAMLIQMGIATIRLKKRLKSAQSVPSEWKRIADEIITELGIRCNISVVMIEGFPSPALSAGLKPVVVLPKELLDKSGEAVRFALLHELTHIKRGDHIASLLLLVLRAVYWFNPIVWLTVGQMRLDMETACDSRLTRPMSTFDKKRYAGTMLSMYAREQVRYVLGMAIGQTKKTAERRLRGMFMRSKSSFRGRVMTVLLTALLLVTCFTTACQPTPEVEAVVGRQEDVLEDVETVEPDDFEPIEVPEHISETHDLEYVKINYDADVVVPDVTAYPVTEVTERVFTDEDVLSYIDLFTGSNYEMYSGWSLSKDDYLSLLTKAKQYEGTERVTEDIIRRLEEIYEKAESDDGVNIPIESFSELPDDPTPSVFIKTPDGVISHYGWQRNYFGYKRDDSMENYSASTVADDLYYEKMDGSIENYNWKQPDEPDISQEDAYAIALRFKDALGIDLELYSIEPCSFIKDYVEKTTGWQFMFKREIAGLKTMELAGSLGWREETAPSYGSPWGVEKLIVSVDKDGLFSFGWRGASTISRTVAESGKLVDFDAIHQRITNQLSFNYAYAAEENGNYEIEISEIRLGISMTSMENRTDIGEYLPTWYVYYRYKPENMGESEWYSQQIMFNAIDGSYIEPRITVDDLMGNMEVGASDSASSSWKSAG